MHDGIRSHMPDWENMKKPKSRMRRRNPSPNPVTLAELGKLPERFERTYLEENFLIFDSENNEARVLVFATRRNSEI